MYTEDFMEWPPEERAAYSCDDARNTYDLAAHFRGYLEYIDLFDYYQKYMAPMSYVTCTMEKLGIRVKNLLGVYDEIQQQVDALSQEVASIMGPQKVAYIDTSKYAGDKQELQQQLLSIVSMAENPEEYLLKGGTSVSLAKSKLLSLYESTREHPFWRKVLAYNYEPSNPNSYVQLANYFLERGYKMPYTGTGRYSVSADTLEELYKQHPEDPIFGPLFKMRSLQKLQSTYVTPLLELAWQDGSVHPEWNQIGTVTGRYSTSVSSENKHLVNKRGPALQTIPRQDTLEEAGWPYNPREWFIPRQGYVFCVADLSQAEVRMLAVMSGDKALKEAVNSGEDLHSNIAAKLWGPRWTAASDEKKKVLRSHAKQVTFGRPVCCAEVKPVQLLEAPWGNQQPEATGMSSNGSETHSTTRTVVVWDAQA